MFRKRFLAVAVCLAGLSMGAPAQNRQQPPADATQNKAPDITEMMPYAHYSYEGAEKAVNHIFSGLYHEVNGLLGRIQNQDMEYIIQHNDPGAGTKDCVSYAFVGGTYTPPSRITSGPAPESSVQRCWHGFAVKWSVQPRLPYLVTYQIHPDKHKALTQKPVKLAPYEFPVRTSRAQLPPMRLADVRKAGYLVRSFVPVEHLWYPKDWRWAQGTLTSFPLHPAAAETWDRMDKEILNFALRENKQVWVAAGIAWPELLNKDVFWKKPDTRNWDSVKRLNGRNSALIPAVVWKAVYVPEDKKMGVFWLENGPSKDAGKPRLELLGMFEMRDRSSVNILWDEGDNTVPKLEKKNPPRRWMPQAFGQDWLGPAAAAGPEEAEKEQSWWRRLLSWD